jgi:hypothetical protein
MEAGQGEGPRSWPCEAGCGGIAIDERARAAESVDFAKSVWRRLKKGKFVNHRFVGGRIRSGKLPGEGAGGLRLAISAAPALTTGLLPAGNDPSATGSIIALPCQRDVYRSCCGRRFPACRRLPRPRQPHGLSSVSQPVASSRTGAAGGVAPDRTTPDLRPKRDGRPATLGTFYGIGRCRQMSAIGTEEMSD